jgi:dienelactone hydrolase
VTVDAPHRVITRHGEVTARFYEPERATRRTVLLVPGIHSMGVEEPRLTALARDLAGAGMRVMALALPDLQRYRITLDATDVLEDAVAWMASQESLAPDGKIGVLGVSFAGGLAIAAAGRPAIRDRVAFVVSFGGHGDLRRVMHYLTTGEAPVVAGLTTHPPHDYGVAVILYDLADRGVVPDDQVAGLRHGVETFLLASQLTLVSMDEANATFAKARAMAEAMPEPSRTYMGYVNDRSVTKLGPVLAPFLVELGADNPAVSPERGTTVPSARIYLLHGHDDTVIPAAESAILGERLRQAGANVRVLLSGLITHAELNDSASWRDAWQLVSFWEDVLRQ